MAVLQGSVAGPLLFLIFINDLALATDLDTLLFANDTQIGSNLYDIYNKVNLNLIKIESWFNANKLTLNASETKYMLV